VRIDPAGWPFVLGGLLLAIIALWLFKPVVGITILVLTTFSLLFPRSGAAHRRAGHGGAFAGRRQGHGGGRLCDPGISG